MLEGLEVSDGGDPSAAPQHSRSDVRRHRVDGALRLPLELLLLLLE